MLSNPTLVKQTPLRDTSHFWWGVPQWVSSHCLSDNEANSIIQQQVDECGHIGDVNSTVNLDISAIKVNICSIT